MGSSVAHESTASDQGVPSSPRAQRLRRPRWTDARLLVGAVLVLGAIITGAGVLGQGEGPQHWVAAADLPTGHVLTAEDLRAADGASPEGVYLTGENPAQAAEGRVLVRPVAAGEFVPASAVGTPRSLDLRRVAVEVTPGSAAMLRPGVRADLWATPRPTAGERSTPRARKVLEGVEVARVQEGDARMAAANQPVPVDVLVPTGSVEELLVAVGGDAEVTAVPVAGTDGPR